MKFNLFKSAERESKKKLAIVSLVFAFLLVAGSAIASMTFDTNTITSTGAINLNPTGQPVTVNGDLTVTGRGSSLTPDTFVPIQAFEPVTDPLEAFTQIHADLTTSQPTYTSYGAYNAGISVAARVGTTSDDPNRNIYTAGLFNTVVPSTNANYITEVDGVNSFVAYNGTSPVAPSEVSGVVSAVMTTGVAERITGLYGGLDVFADTDFLEGVVSDNWLYGNATAAQWNGLRVNAGIQDTSTVTSLRGLWIMSPSKAAGATITANTAILISQQDVGGTNFTIDAIDSTAPSRFGGSITATDFIVGSTSIKPLRGVTGAISGALTIGACNTGTAAVTGATTAMVAAASPTNYPGTGITWDAYVSSANTVTVVECGLASVTPTSTTFQVSVTR